MVVGHDVVFDGGAGHEHVDGGAREIAAIHVVGVACSRVVFDDVVGEIHAVRTGSRDAPALVLVVVFAEHHRFERGVMNRVVFGNDVRGAVNPQAVVTFNRADVVVVNFNVRGADTKTGTAACS